MVEKTFTLDNISLVDFLGVENQNIREIASAFPESKLVSRGNEIQIKGSTNQIQRIMGILNSMVIHYERYGKISKEHVASVLNDDHLMEEHKSDVIVFGNRGTKIGPKTPHQVALIEEVKKNDLVFVVGPAGTGKTFISVALAVRALKAKEVKKIIITRPAVEAGENLGFLPGDLREKIDPYLRPVYDALSEMLTGDKLKYYQENGVIEIAPLAYMRGRTLNNAYVLLDEAQNTTPMQLKMFMTRMGPESKMIVTGDITQIDLPKNQKSGLVHALDVLYGVEGIGVVRLNEMDVVRHRLVKNIIRAYKKHRESEN